MFVGGGPRDLNLLQSISSALENILSHKLLRQLRRIEESTDVRHGVAKSVGRMLCLTCFLIQGRVGEVRLFSSRNWDEIERDSASESYRWWYDRFIVVSDH